MSEDTRVVHYKTPDGLIHIAELETRSRAYCILRCWPEKAWQTAQGDVDLPATCLSCLAADSMYKEAPLHGHDKHEGDP